VIAMGISNLDERLKIIEKAEPETARKLRERYLIEDKKGKENMRWLIDITAEKILNKNDILLPFIPQELIWGEINLGKVLSGKKELYNFYLKKEQLLKHLGVFGSTGSGKTNFIHHLIKELAKQKIPVLVFDFSKQNYRNLPVDKKILEPASFNFNPLNPPAGTSREVWAKKFAEVFDHAYWLLGGGKSIILSALNKLSDSEPTLSDLRKEVGGMDNRKLPFRERNWIATAKRALDSLCLSGFSGNGDPSQLLKGVTVFELEELVDEDKTFFIEIVLQWLRNWLLKNWEKGIAGVIVLEESHYVLNREKSRQLGRETVMDRLFREIRGLGMGIIFTDQHPSLISYPALGNSATQIYMRLKLDSKHSSDIEDAARMLGLDKEERNYLSKLPIGYGIIRTEQFSKPFLLKFPLVSEKKPTDYDTKKIGD